jgi:phosphoglycolate phosphatase-like HAD superfamily hydrolase
MIGNLRELVSGKRHILLDFDGPVCDVYAGVPAPTIAARLRNALHRAGIEVSDDIAHDGDPLEVFRSVAQVADKAATIAQQELIALGQEAIATARPTPGSAELITTATGTDRTVSIVSNNSGTAVCAYLAAHRLADRITAVVGRDNPDPLPDETKPLSGQGGGWLAG